MIKENELKEIYQLIEKEDIKDFEQKILFKRIISNLDYTPSKIYISQDNLEILFMEDDNFQVTFHIIRKEKVNISIITINDNFKMKINKEDFYFQINQDNLENLIEQMNLIIKLTILLRGELR